MPVNRDVSHSMNRAMGPPMRKNMRPPANSVANSGMITTGMSEPSQRGSLGKVSQ